MESFSSVDEWSKHFERSGETPVAVFKHSAACGISQYAIEKMRAAVKDGLFPGPVYLVVVQNQRDISDRIAGDLDLKHETPQAIVVRNGSVAYAASHGNIDAEEMAEAMK